MKLAYRAVVPVLLSFLIASSIFIGYRIIGRSDRTEAEIRISAADQEKVKELIG